MLRHPARLSLSVIATAAGAALLAGCGGGTPSSAAASPKGSAADRYQQLVSFSQCMRTHGVPGFPDPVRSGNAIGLQIQGGGPGAIKPDSPAFVAAQKACGHLLPNGGRPPGRCARPSRSGS
jgi:hypothetical protein